MTTSTTLIELILSLLRDPAQRAAFREDPEGFLASCGNFTVEDVKDAIDLADVRDSHGNHIHVPPAPHPKPHPGESDHEAAVRYLNTYITNNYIDDRDITNIVNQEIDNRGGRFEQDIDFVSNSGDGAVVAGEDIEDSTVVTGDNNQIGDGNVQGSGNVVGDGNQAVTGDDNATSFGSGDVSTVGGSVSVGPGGAYSGTGNATADNDDESINDSFNTTTNTTVEDSFNSSTSVSTDDDVNYSSTSYTDSSTNTHTETTIEDSYNFDA
ncbi:hypothetical protein SAMN05443637_12926 [Pseudonocardia thermophila]|jgi:hypothetical protein|uniref:Uncharacterized protein n=1 Tax=Pseudonocardia thermophila TaxID=1848 RepID=A0A1M7APK9_PSETH|nr:IniB N-terminal domain-containing protein [Pseudonocardia thermophila]SHL44595.1 hypothetical protein SAMN05443637_12926 [Pseudonocardia thermophila]